MVNNEVICINGLSRTTQNQIESKNYNDYYNMCNVIGKKISSINPKFIKSEAYSDMCNTVNKKIPFIEKIEANHSNPNRSMSKCHGDNAIDSNYNMKKNMAIKSFSCTILKVLSN